MQKTILTWNINDFMGLQFEPTAEVKWNSEEND